MAIGLYYTMEFTNVENVFVKVLIGDTTVETDGTPQIIPLDAAGSPLVISTIDNEENKFSPIKGQQAAITFHSNGQTSLLTFADGPDDRFPVTILYGTTIIFHGFLSLADNQEAFLPARNEVTLIANDKLGALKDIPLTDFGGSVVGINPEGKYTLGQFVAMCLQKTGLSLPLRIINNLRHEGSAGHMYHETYLDAKTFEEEIGVSENCYDVLSKILGYDCFIIQYKECWWICRVDEYDDNPFSVARFDENGEFIDVYEENNLVKSIGKDDTHWFEGEATDVLPTRPINLAKLTYNYNYPLEIICNQSFERGDFIEDLPPETNADGVEEQVKSYGLECWDSLSVGPGGITLASYDQAPIAGSDLYVKKYFFREEERRRELVIKATTGAGNGRSYMKSQPIEVTVKDLINLSVSVDYSNIGGSSGFSNSPVLVGLFANSGNIYFWQAHDESNPNTPQSWTMPTGVAPANWYLGAAIDEGRSDMSYESPPLPESGKLYIYLINQYGEEVTAHYDQPEITITPFVNGSYRLYKGRYHKVQRTEEGYLAKIEDEVFISDAFGKTLKGAMLKEGAAAEIYSGVADFGSVGQINIDGNVESLFTIGTKIIVSGSANNNITATITNTNYSIIGDTTEIITDAATTTEINATVVINEVGFVLTDLWYDASKHAIGDPDIIIQPFGWLQAYSVWNQYRLANRIFQTQFQGFGEDIPSLVHKYLITDVSPHSISRSFLMLTCEKDLMLCNMTGTIEQVYHSVEGKSYDDPHEFKYIS